MTHNDDAFSHASLQAEEHRTFTSQEVSPDPEQSLDLSNDPQQRFILLTPAYTDIRGIHQPARWKLKPRIPYKKQFSQLRWGELPELQTSHQDSLF